MHSGDSGRLLFTQNRSQACLTPSAAPSPYGGGVLRSGAAEQAQCVALRKHSAEGEGGAPLRGHHCGRRAAAERSAQHCAGTLRSRVPSSAANAPGVSVCDDSKIGSLRKSSFLNFIWIFSVLELVQNFNSIEMTPKIGSVRALFLIFGFGDLDI